MSDLAVIDKLRYVGLFDEEGKGVGVVRCATCGTSFCVRDEDADKIRWVAPGLSRDALEWMTDRKVCCESPVLRWIRVPRLFLSHKAKNLNNGNL